MSIIIKVALAVYCLACLIIAWWYQVQYHQLKQEYDRVWEMIMNWQKQDIEKRGG